jgi:hypothetical protein
MSEIVTLALAGTACVAVAWGLCERDRLVRECQMLDASRRGLIARLRLAESQPTGRTSLDDVDRCPRCRIALPQGEQCGCGWTRPF